MGIEEIKIEIAESLLLIVKTVLVVISEWLIEKIEIEITRTERVTWGQTTAAVIGIDHGRRICDSRRLHCPVRLLILLRVLIRSVARRHIALIRIAGIHCRLLLCE